MIDPAERGRAGWPTQHRRPKIGSPKIGSPKIGSPKIGSPTAATLALAVAVLVPVLVLRSATAHAYVRYLSSDGHPYAWRPASIPVSAYPQGISTMTTDQMINALTQSITAWTKDAPQLSACTYVSVPVTIQPMVDAVPDSKYDHVNNITLRGDAWSTLCSVDASGNPVCHDPSALAITSVFAKTSGEIVDADIEVNAVNFDWADLVATSPGPGFQDLQNAVTHESGHFLGLDHTCYIYSSGGADDPAHPRPNDQNGQPIPNCSDAPPAVVATTMFASAEPGDVSKRTLEADDLQAICDIYPIPWHDRFAVSTSGGCAVAPGAIGGDTSAGSALASAAAGLALAVIATRARRRRD